jgi:hypothetical protein
MIGWQQADHVLEFEWKENGSTTQNANTQT